MAWSNWITLASSASWGGSPSITAKFEYAYQRSGADMQYKVRVTINTLPYSSSYFGYPIYATIKLDGTTKISAHQIKAASPSQWSSAIVYTTNVLTVSGKTTGTTSLSINLFSGSGESRDRIYSYSLTVAPAASSFAAVPDFAIGTAGNIKLTRYNSDFTNTVTIKIGTRTETISTKQKLTTVPWTPSEDWYSVLTAVTTSVGTVTVTTFDSSGKTVGSNTHNIKLSVPASVVPTALSLTLTPVNDNAWIADKGIYVAGHSKVKAESSATPGTGSSMKSYAISGGAGTGSGAIWTSDVLKPGEKSITMTAKDARGRSSSITKKIIVQPYAAPNISNLIYERGDYTNEIWTPNEQGDDIKVAFSLGLSLSEYSNLASIDIKADAISKATTSEQGAGSKAFYLTNIGTDSTVAVTVAVTDSVGKTSDMEITVATVSVPMNINFDLPGFAIGKVAEKVKALECAWDAYFDKNVQVDGTLKAGTLETVGAATFGGNVSGKWLSGTWLRSTAHSDLGATPESYPVFGDGWLYSRTLAEMRADLAAYETVTLTVVSGRLTDLNYTARYYPMLGMCFVRIYGKIAAAMNQGYDYNLLNIGARTPANNTALAVKCGKKIHALAKSNGVIVLRPHDDGINGYDIYISGFWFA